MQFWRARQVAPKSGAMFYTVVLKNGIHLVFQRDGRRPAMLQTILLPRTWTPRRARAWLQAHGYRSEIDEIAASPSGLKRLDVARLERGAKIEASEHPWLTTSEARRVAGDHLREDPLAYPPRKKT